MIGVVVSTRLTRLPDKAVTDRAALPLPVDLEVFRFECPGLEAEKCKIGERGVLACGLRSRW
jgi:hypothetical protein